MAQGCIADVYGPNPANHGRVEVHKCGNDALTGSDYCHIGTPGNPSYRSNHVKQADGWGSATTVPGGYTIPAITGVGELDEICAADDPLAAILEQAEAIRNGTAPITWPRSPHFVHGDTPERELAEERHLYFLPTGEIGASVTSALGDTVGSIGKTKGMVAAAVRLTKENKDYQEIWDAKRDKGSRAHKALEAIGRGETPVIEDEGDRAIIKQLQRWVEKYKPTFVLQELVVLSHHGYGGRFDSIITLENPETGEMETWLIDLKTGWKDIAAHLQAPAYAEADGAAVYDADGWLIGTTPLPKIDRIGGLYLNPEKDEAELVEFKRKPGDFAHFLNLVHANEFIKEFAREVQAEEREQRYHKAAVAVAAAMHEDRRRAHQNADGTFEPVLIATMDSVLGGTRHGTYQFDMANTEYRYLPSDGKETVAREAEHAVALVRSLGRKWANPAFLEAAAERVHQGRLQRLGPSADPADQVPFGELADESREFNRDIIRKAITATGWRWTDKIPKPLPKGTEDEPPPYEEEASAA